MKTPLLSFVIATTASLAQIAQADNWMDHLDIQGPVTLFTGPSKTAHQPFSDLLIHATSDATMEMFHLLDPQVVLDLVAAESRLHDVTVIVDGKSLRDKSLLAAEERLVAGRVTVVKSSPAFSITHTKSLIVDKNLPTRKAIVSSMNLTAEPEYRRDYGVVLSDPGIIQEMDQVFQADVENAGSDTMNTPALSDPHLLWSPINSNQKLHDMIYSATSTIEAVAENVLDDGLINDLIDAHVSNRVTVWVLSPACPLGQKPYGNYSAAKKLQAAGIMVRQMPTPATPSALQPYLHGKMMVIDGAFPRMLPTSKAYLGSINYSRNSLNFARELGIALNDANVVKGLHATFVQDFNQAIELPASADDYKCVNPYDD